MIGTDIWDGPRRRDGLMVTRVLEGTWAIIPSDARPVISACPCCGQPLASGTAARLVADVVYPLEVLP